MRCVGGPRFFNWVVLKDLSIQSILGTCNILLQYWLHHLRLYADRSAQEALTLLSQPAVISLVKELVSNSSDDLLRLRSDKSNMQGWIGVLYT